MNNTPRWIRDAYKGTTAHWSKTQTQIIKMLNELGVSQIRFTSLPDSMVMEFVVALDEASKPRAVRFITPLGTEATNMKAREREMDTLCRVMLYQLKAKFIAIGKGLVEFETEFMAHLIVKDGKGGDMTMGKALLPQYRDNLENGTGAFNLLGDGK